MSIPERIFNISKAYLREVRDRIDSGLSDAERELDATPGAHAGDGRDMYDDDLSSRTDPEAMMRRAEARIAAARRELETRNNELAAAAGGAATPENAAPTAVLSVTTPATVAAPIATEAEADPNYHDYRVLGVPIGSDLAQVQAAYEQLTRRCDPRRFPEGSTEQKQAEIILQRVNNAFESLRRRLDPNIARFGKLELE